MGYVFYTSRRYDLASILSGYRHVAYVGGSGVATGIGDDDEGTTVDQEREVRTNMQPEGAGTSQEDPWAETLVGHLPGGLTPKDISPDDCPKCYGCKHPDVNDFEVISHSDGTYHHAHGDCSECGARVEGKVRRTGPDDYEAIDSQWDISSDGCGHGHDPDDDEEFGDGNPAEYGGGSPD